MTEPEVASSDATNIATSIVRDGDEYVITGRKWWTSGAPDPRCKILIVMGQSDPENPDRHKRQSMILVPLPHPGVEIQRALPVFGFDDAPHGHAEIVFDGARVPAGNILLGPGRGFEIAQGRLGPGRIHHCMRLIGLAERALERMCRRLSSRVAFGKTVAEQSVWRERIAESRILIEQARLLTLKAAYLMDTVGNRAALKEIAMIKVAAPNMACTVIDWAIQAFGGAGVTNDFGLGHAYANARTLRLADGPDEVHRDQIARMELRGFQNDRAAETGTSVEILPPKVLAASAANGSAPTVSADTPPVPPPARRHAAITACSSRRSRRRWAGACSSPNSTRGSRPVGKRTISTRRAGTTVRSRPPAMQTSNRSS
jgi:acyl-CoA dehydrogenase